MLSGESHCTGVTGYGGKAWEVKYLNNVLFPAPESTQRMMEKEGRMEKRGNRLW